MNRLASMARFDETIPEPAFVPGHRCASCEQRLVVGDEVTESYDADIVHDDCWREYCDMMYKNRRGIIDKRGRIE